MDTLMRRWWTGDPADPDITGADDPDVRRLLHAVAPGSPATDLGGCFSLNLHLHDLGLVLRRAHSDSCPATGCWRCGRYAGGWWRTVCSPPSRSAGTAGSFSAAVVAGWSWESCPHAKPEATWESYRWMYRAMGELHRALRDVKTTLPRPVIATYAPPGSLRRWLAVTESAVAHDAGAAEVAASLRRMLARLRAQWVPAPALPNQVVHGDVRLGNVGLTPHGDSVYLDFGFAARRPRVHDLAYSLAWVILRPDSSGSAATFDWSVLPELLGEYEESARARLTPLERRALGPYVATVPMYHAALAGYDADPVAAMGDRSGFLRIASWLLDNPEATRT